MFKKGKSTEDSAVIVALNAEEIEQAAAATQDESAQNKDALKQIAELKAELAAATQDESAKNKEALKQIAELQAELADLKKEVAQKFKS